MGAPSSFFEHPGLTASQERKTALDETAVQERLRGHTPE